MFPYRDNFAIKQVTWGVIVIVVSLCVINIPLFLVPQWHQTSLRLLGFFPILFSVETFSSSYRLITAALLHGDFFHLAGNCLFLVVFGKTLEQLFGTKLFLLIFPALGITGLFLEWALFPTLASPVIGASGAVAALMGAYLPLFPNAKIRMIIFFGWFWKRFTVPAWVFLPYWMGIQIISVALGADDGIAYGVHAGSFAAGLIGAIIWKTSYTNAEEHLSRFTAEAIT